MVNKELDEVTLCLDWLERHDITAYESSGTVYVAISNDNETYLELSGRKVVSRAELQLAYLEKQTSAA